MGRSSILYQRKDRDITLLDIPDSIREAQDFEHEGRQLLSSPPLQAPWQATEPKSQAARARAGPRSVLDQDLARTVENALAVMRSEHHGVYGNPRVVAKEAAQASKRARPDSEGVGEGARGASAVKVTGNRGRGGVGQTCLALQGDACVSEVGHLFIYNASDGTVGLHCGERVFLVPRLSSFYLADCGDSAAFGSSFSSARRASRRPRQFSAIVMDPPWPNASVKRGSKQGRTQYQTCATMWDMRQLLFEVDIGALLARDGVVGVWITNHPGARELVLSSEDGLFESWGVGLVEEWIWTKITMGGEPIFPVDGTLRKPYEVLLVGKKGRVADETGEVKRRVLFAMPDLHSRKPCLKRLLQDAFALEEGGLEIFARNLVSGWTSWGNEVLKFNDSRCWAEGA